jgi:hypothetical protein
MKNKNLKAMDIKTIAEFYRIVKNLYGFNRIV